MFDDLGSDFRCFSWSVRVSESTRCAEVPILILTNRRGNSEGSRFLCTNGKLSKKRQKIGLHSESSRSCNVTSKNNENRSEIRSKIVENHVSRPLQSSSRTSFHVRGAHGVHSRTACGLQWPAHSTQARSSWPCSRKSRQRLRSAWIDPSLQPED